MTCKLNII